MQTSDDSVGMQCICVGCGQRTTIQLDESNANNQPRSVGRTQAEDKISTAREKSRNQDDGSSGVESPARKSEIISVSCPICQHQLDYTRNLVGTKGLCRNCHEVFLLPDKGEAIIAEVADPDSIAFACSSCSQLFEGKTSQIGKKGRCTNCRSVFTILAIERKPPENRRPIVEPVKSSRPKTVATPPSVYKPSTPPAKKKPAKPAAATRPSQPVEPVSLDEWSAFDPNFGSVSSQGWENSPSTAYAASTVSLGSRSRSLGFGEIIEHTFNHMFPGLFYLYLPFLIMFLVGIVAWAIMIGADFAGDFLVSDFPIGALIVKLGALIIAFVGQIVAAVWIYPSFFRIANAAVKGREVSTDLLDTSFDIRLNMVGYILLQGLVSLVFSLPMIGLVIIASLSQSLVLLVVAMLAVFGFSLFYSNFFLIGGCAVVDRKTPFEAVQLSFSIPTKNFGVFLGLNIVEAILMVPLICTIVGFYFFGFQYLILRSATCYHLSTRK